MHQLKDAEVPREHHRRSRGSRGKLSASRSAGSKARLRVVRVPGGFAYVEERPVMERS
jgi:hypothetical protein